MQRILLCREHSEKAFLWPRNLSIYLTREEEEAASLSGVICHRFINLASARSEAGAETKAPLSISLPLGGARNFSLFGCSRKSIERKSARADEIKFQLAARLAE
jgi:hypothetical protein